MTNRVILFLVLVAASQYVAEARRRRRRLAMPAGADAVDRVLRSDKSLFLQWLALGLVRWALLALALLVVLNTLALLLMFGKV